MRAITISNTLSSITAAGTGSQTVFSFPFVADAASDLVVTQTSAASVSQLIPPSQYTVALGATPSNQIWPTGGTVTMTSAPTAGSLLTISRVLPLQQNISIINQGNVYPQVTEQALDILQMQIQQVAADVTAISVGSSAAAAVPYVFVCGAVGGTPNALTVSSTNPPNFSLNNGTFITFTPTAFNAAGATTLNVLGTGNINLYRLSPNGPTPVTQGDIIPVPLLAQYISSIPGWFVINDIYSSSATTVGTATNLGIGTTFIPYVTTAPVTFTVAKTTTLPIFWYNEINANGGAATITPNAADSIVVGGSTLSNGVSFTIPSLQSAKLFTDGNGHLYLNYLLPQAATNVGTFTNPTITVNANGLVTAASSGGSAGTFPTAISGLLIGNIAGASNSATATISSGICTDSSNVVYISAASKTWAVSNGNAINGYSGGTTLPNSSTIHIYECSGVSGNGVYGIPNASYPLTASSAPSGYTSNVRRIGSFNTNTSGAPIPYTGIELDGGGVINWLTTQVLDVNVTSPSTSTNRLLYSLTVPSGIKVAPQIRFTQTSNAGGNTIVTSGDETDVSAASTVANATFSLAPGYDGSALNGTGEQLIMWSKMLTTNTSGQLGIRSQQTTSVSYFLVTAGFIDFRRN